MTSARHYRALRFRREPRASEAAQGIFACNATIRGSNSSRIPLPLKGEKAGYYIAAAAALHGRGQMIGEPRCEPVVPTFVGLLRAGLFLQILNVPTLLMRN